MKKLLPNQLIPKMEPRLSTRWIKMQCPALVFPSSHAAEDCVLELHGLGNIHTVFYPVVGYSRLFLVAHNTFDPFLLLAMLDSF